VKPGVYELPMGTPLREIIYDHAGGIPNGRKLKGVIPGGASMPVFTPEEIDVAMDMDSVQKAGSFLGSAGVMVMDDTVCMVWATLNLAHFFHHESCGQCTPCREGRAGSRRCCTASKRATPSPVTSTCCSTSPAT
jgi:NADH-quinone oxidoreductase subunit F